MLIGILLFGIGLLGEYVGRIYEQVRLRPRYVVQAVLEKDDGENTVPRSYSGDLAAQQVTRG